VLKERKMKFFEPIEKIEAPENANALETGSL
jgi:hypothetical protein